jgi:hypothetical protein
MGDDHSDVTLNKLGGKLSGQIASPLSVADVKRDIASFRVAKILQSTSQRIGKWVGLRCGDQKADAGHLCGWLRNRVTTRGQQPSRAAAEQVVALPDTRM